VGKVSPDLHFLDKASENLRRRCVAPLRQAHRLLDHHQATRQQTQPAEAPGIRLVALRSSRLKKRSWHDPGRPSHGVPRQKVALVAAMRKLITMPNAIARHGSQWDPTLHPA